MRSPEHRIAHPRAGKHFEDELQLRYMSPGAFTVLPPDNNPPPDPPTAPEPYRLTPATRRHKNQSFAIIGEVDTSRPNSRSPSPTGRVSPFRGRGFNPSGSRHASPNPSPPPPEDARLTPTNLSPQHASKIPKLKRKGSNLVFGEKVYHYEAPQARRRLDTQLSQSMTNLEVKNVATRPPHSPRKNVYSKTPAFQRLSPIVGSSPEPSQSLSSPSRIPKSRSTPPSRRTSPTRTIPTLAGKPPPSKSSSRALSRSNSRSQSRSQSRSVSREPSPAKNPMSPTRIPVSKYKNVQAKVNSNNKPKPKVPPKPQVLSEQSEESSDVSQIVKNKPILSRKESVNKIRTNSRSNLLPKTENNSNNTNNNTSDSSSSMVTKTNRNSTKSNIGNNNVVGIVDKTTRDKIEEKNEESSQKRNNVITKEAEKRKNNNSDISSDTKDITEKKRNNNIDSSTTAKDILEKRKTNNSRSSSPTKDIPEKRKNHNTDSVLTRKDSRRDMSKATNAGATDSPYSIKKTTDSSSEDQQVRQHGSPVKLADRQGRQQGSPVKLADRQGRQHGSPVKLADRQGRNSESPVKLADILPSTTTVVTSTTSTVTQPLKIETNLNLSKPSEKPKPVSPMVDGRVLSATSVSNAMNKMNDTVLNTQTVFKDHGFTKLSPAANAVISMSNEIGKATNPALDTKHATSALPTVEPVSNKPENVVIDIGNNFRGNNHTNHVTHAGFVSSKALEMEVQRNMSRLISPEHNNMGNSMQKSVNDRIKEARTVVAADVKPIRITVKEKPSDVEVQSGNVRLPVSVSNGLNERPGLPPAQQTPPNEPVKETPPKNVCARFFSNCRNNMSCQCCKKDAAPEDKEEEVEEKKGCFGCMKKKERKEESVRINIEDETEKKPTLWDKLKCCDKHKVGDTNCFPTGKRKNSWVERRDSILSDPSQQQPQPRSRCSRDCCRSFFRKLFCMNLCCKKKVEEDPISRKASIISKKKSLTPTTAPPPEDTGPKIDLSLVEHSSHMKGAIPVLPVCLAWFCLIMNCIAPGTGTIFSGFFCLCIGKPRFSQKDRPKQRIGSFFINAIIGFGQFFTVLFCLVGWGWSIWWGLIMLRVAKKHKKLKHLQAIEDATSRPVPVINQNHQSRGPQRNS